MPDCSSALPTEGEGLRIRGLHSSLAGPFDLDVDIGRCAAITGPSGSGRSLFLRMVADLDPNEGEVALDGVARDSLPAPEWRRRAVYLAAEPGWWAPTVEAHFDPVRHGEALALATELGLTAAHLSGEVQRLSTGERQRLALIRGLLADPQALLLDEPTAALDQDSVGRVAALLVNRKARGLIVLLVTHDEELAEKLGDVRRRMANRRFGS